MTFAISHSLLYPERGACVCEPLDFTKAVSIDFAPPDTDRFPCLRHAYNALKKGGTATAVFNASNEVAVAEFIKGRLPWIKIADVIEKTLDAVETKDPQTLDDILADDALARIRAAEIIAAMA